MTTYTSLSIKPMNNREGETTMSDKTSVEYWMQSENFRQYTLNCCHHNYNPWRDPTDVIEKQMEAFEEALLSFLESFPNYCNKVVLSLGIPHYQDEVREIFVGHIALAKGRFRKWLTALAQNAKDWEDRWNS